MFETFIDRFHGFIIFDFSLCVYSFYFFSSFLLFVNTQMRVCACFRACAHLPLYVCVFVCALIFIFRDQINTHTFVLCSNIIFFEENWLDSLKYTPFIGYYTPIEKFIWMCRKKYSVSISTMFFVFALVFAPFFFVCKIFAHKIMCILYNFFVFANYTTVVSLCHLEIGSARTPNHKTFIHQRIPAHIKYVKWTN